MTITYEQIPWTPPAKPDDGGDKKGSGKTDDPDGYERIAAGEACKHKEEKQGCVDGFRCGGLKIDDADVEKIERTCVAKILCDLQSEVNGVKG